jgi:hypothetical protein
MLSYDLEDLEFFAKTLGGHRASERISNAYQIPRNEETIKQYAVNEISNYVFKKVVRG